MTAPISAAEERLDQAHADYRMAVARLDLGLRAAGDTKRLQLAWQALAEEADALVALALALADGATSNEIETANAVADAKSTTTTSKLAAIGVTHPTRLRQAAEQLLAAAIQAAFPATPALAVAS